MKEIEGLINENGYSVGKGFGENSYFVDDPILQKEMKRKRMNAKMNKPDTNTTIVMAARLWDFLFKHNVLYLKGEVFEKIVWYTKILREPYNLFLWKNSIHTLATTAALFEIFDIIYI